MRLPHLRSAAAVGASVVAVLPAAASATSIPERTLLASVSPTGQVGDGASRHPALSASGRVLAFDSTASNMAGPDLNGSVRDVIAIDLATNERRLVSAPLSPMGADGPSSDPTMSSDGQVVGFVSAATNLVAGDTNGVLDVFARAGRAPIVLVSRGIGGAPANGASGEADMSAKATRIAFTSAASNLVPNDTNGQPDIFVRDLTSGTTVRVSVSSTGAQANARSMSPAISADGRYVAFTSVASNLVSRDTNGIADVFVRDLATGRTERVSVSSKGRQQERSVQPPFVQTPDISDDGRYVVFDSDATRLYTPDTNQHTDVFLRDRKRKRTTLVSANSVNVEGNNDSFAPRLSPKGRFLTFQSFATNLAIGDGPREDIYVRDLKLGTTSVVNVTASGIGRGDEQVPQLLQRPSVSSNGRFAAFSSTVSNLAAGDTNNQEDVFVRMLDAPVGRVVQRPRINRSGVVKIKTDDPQAFTYVCQIDKQPLLLCGPTIEITRPIGHTLKIRVGGPGMLYDDDVLKVPLNNDHRKPTIRISKPPRGGLRVIRGRASDASGIAAVQVSVAYASTKGCKILASRNRFSRKFSFATCPKVKFFNASGTRSWRLRLPQRIKGYVVIYALAYDRVGNTRVVVRRGVVS